MKKIILQIVTIAIVIGVLTSPASARSVYTVQAGDSMWAIAQKFKVSFAEILRLNKNYPNPALIHPNDLIVIPEGSHGIGTIEHSEKDNIAQGNASALEGSASAFENEVLRLVNQERAKQGLNALTLDTKLLSLAEMKAQDMAEKGYFDHTSPTYGTPFEMLQHYGVRYRSAGENIAAGQKTAQEVMQSWMNSSGHRANILNAGYTKIGIGYKTGGKYRTYWTQLFIGE